MLQADRNRDKFQHISNSELTQRKRFVEDMSKEISGEYPSSFELCSAWTPVQSDIAH